MSKYTNDEKIKILNKASNRFYDYVYNYGSELLVTDVRDIYRIAIAARLHELIVYDLVLNTGAIQVFSDSWLDYFNSDNINIDEIYDQELFAKTVDTYLFKVIR